MALPVCATPLPAGSRCIAPLVVPGVVSFQLTPWLSIYTLPATSSFSLGLVVPIPTLPKK